MSPNDKILIQPYMLTEARSTEEDAPILVQNVVPGIDKIEKESDKFKHDMNLRPDEASLEDYERVPIEAFGAALLRGMGWKEGQVVGKNKSGILEPILQKPRPHLLGLGAEPAPPVPTKGKKYIKPGEKRPEDPFKVPLPPAINKEDMPRREEQEKGGYSIGDKVLIKAGRYKGKSGEIVDVKQKSDGLAAKVQLLKDEGVARVWMDEVEPYDTESNQSNTKTTGWLRPRIRVRVISKSLAQGKYYNEKGVIQDVVSRDHCIVRTSHGDLIDG
jgi:G patch domain/KOW motif-containing protein